MRAFSYTYTRVYDIPLKMNEGSRTQIATYHVRDLVSKGSILGSTAYEYTTR